uniref:Uncharacterized protein n=1 Tax=Cannabis sativa TaxID=3483 RepID=A0A803Q9J8_CANSA
MDTHKQLFIPGHPGVVNIPQGVGLPQAPTIQAPQGVQNVPVARPIAAPKPGNLYPPGVAPPTLDGHVVKVSGGAYIVGSTKNAQKIYLN